MKDVPQSKPTTKADPQTAIPVAEKLDPVGAFMPYKLFRDATRFHDGKVVKDLSYLNRDLQKVIMLDINPEHGALQPDNTVQMKGWNGEKGDRGLVDMIPFLECASSSASFSIIDRHGMGHLAILSPLSSVR